MINNDFYFVDVPGYGYAKVSKKQREEFGEMIEHYLTNRKNIALVFLLIDFRHKPSEDDVLMYNYLKYLNHKVCIVCTKKDKVRKTYYQKHKKIIVETLNYDENDEFVIVSSETKEGLDRVYEIIEKYKK